MHALEQILQLRILRVDEIARRLEKCEFFLSAVPAQRRGLEPRVVGIVFRRALAIRALPQRHLDFRADVGNEVDHALHLHELVQMLGAQILD